MSDTLLYFDDDGWLQTTSDSWIKVEHRPTLRKWTGMHRVIERDFGDQLHGTVTHYDALPSAERTVAGFTRGKKGASTHFVISRNGDIYQLASIQDRTWHAAFKTQNGKPLEWVETGGRMPLANGQSTSSPNHWCVGVDFSNWGWLTEKNGKYYSHLETVVPEEDVFFDENGKPWERYTDEAQDAYIELLLALSLELDIIPGMHYRHSDTSPTRKTDPGPALNFHSLIEHVYKLVEFYQFYEGYDFDRMGEDNDEV